MNHLHKWHLSFSEELSVDITVKLIKLICFEVKQRLTFCGSSIGSRFSFNYDSCVFKASCSFVMSNLQLGHIGLRVFCCSFVFSNLLFVYLALSNYN